MIEIIEIESREHAKELAKQGGYDIAKVWANLADYYTEIQKEFDKEE